MSFAGFSQKKVTWEDLSHVEFKEKYFPDYGMEFLYPYFSESVKELDGRLISLTGYFINIDPKGEIFVLSREPMASCFFCGATGPETAIEVRFRDIPPYQTDDIVKVTGTLELNSEDVDYMIYIMNDCEIELAND